MSLIKNKNNDSDTDNVLDNFSHIKINLLKKSNSDKLNKGEEDNALDRDTSNSSNNGAGDIINRSIDNDIDDILTIKRD